MTRIHDAEGSLTTANLPAGGAAAAANTDIFLQGSQSLGRRQTNTSDTGGFVLVDAADNDVSANDVHVGVWFWVTHYAILDDVRIAFGTGTGSPTNYDAHTFPLTEIPPLGGFIRAWIDVSRTPENSGGTGLNEAQLRSYGVQVSFTGTPGGNAANLILDAADHIAGAALTLTGTTGLWTDFTTADQNSSNQFGVFRTIGGVFNCFARVQLGSASSLVMNESNFAIVFPQQALVGDTFMGVNIDLQHASTNIDWAGGVLRSAGAKRGDLVVTGTSGDFDATGMTFSALRIVTLTSVCSVLNSSFVSCGQITGAGAVLTGCTVSGYEGTANTSALLWDVNTDPDGKFDNMSFTKGTAATHAIEFGTSSPTTMTLRNVNFTGYNASNNQDDSAIHVKRTTGTVTINVVGGTAPSYRTDGATVTIVVNPVTTLVTVKDINSGSNIQSARVLVLAASGGPMPFQKSTTITRSGSTATASCTAHGLVTNDYVVISGANQQEYNGVFQVTVTNDDTFTYTVSGTPASPATGTITSTGAPLYGTTDANGQVSSSRSFASNQPITGRVRKSTTGTLYKTGVLSGTISNTAGFSATIQMVPDQ